MSVQEASARPDARGVEPEVRRFRLAAVTSHPVQYQAPLFRKLAADPRIDLTVYYAARWGLEYAQDDEFGLVLRWDVPLTSGYRVKFLPNVGWGRGFFRILNPTIVWKLLKGRFDAVFLHSYAHGTALLVYLGAWLSRTPILLRTESELLRGRSWLVRALKRLALGPMLRRTPGVLAIGSLNRAFYEHFGVAPERIFSTPYGVDNDFFSAFYGERGHYGEVVRHELELPSDVPIVLFAGKLIARKRCSDLIEAMSMAAEGSVLRDAALVVVGEGRQRGELEQRVKALKLSNVRFAGFQNQTRIRRYYAAADVFVLPSEFETWGLVLNEAMAAGLPVIASDGVGASRDLIADGRNGFVYSCGDVAGLAACLEDVLGDEERRAEMGRESQARVTDWSLDASARGVLDALDFVACGTRETEAGARSQGREVGAVTR